MPFLGNRWTSPNQGEIIGINKQIDASVKCDAELQGQELDPTTEEGREAYRAKVAIDDTLTINKYLFQNIIREILRQIKNLSFATFLPQSEQATYQKQTRYFLQRVEDRRQLSANFSLNDKEEEVADSKVKSSKAKGVQ